MPDHYEMVCESKLNDEDEFLLPNNIDIKFTASYWLLVDTSAYSDLRQVKSVYSVKHSHY
jgi:hypothetical protein